jgi:ascorbate-specific PTS system EIIC-type component UlaA
MDIWTDNQDEASLTNPNGKLPKGLSFEEFEDAPYAFLITLGVLYAVLFIIYLWYGWRHNALIYKFSSMTCISK